MRRVIRGNCRQPILLVMFCMMGSLQAQSSYLDYRDIKHLTRASFAKKIKKLRQEKATEVTYRTDKDQCEFRTYGGVKNFISAEQWHWGEIITFNSCNKELTYSTANRSHYEMLKAELLKKHTFLGTRVYDGLEFKVFQNRRGQVVEIDDHPNPQGLTFYLFNILRKKKR